MPLPPTAFQSRQADVFPAGAMALAKGASLGNTQPSPKAAKLASNVPCQRASPRRPHVSEHPCDIFVANLSPRKMSPLRSGVLQSAIDLPRSHRLTVDQAPGAMVTQKPCRQSRAATPPPSPVISVSRNKFSAFWQLMCLDPDPRVREYAHSFLAIIANQLGDGLIAGALHVLLDVLGVVTHSLSIVCMVTIDLFEVVLGILGQGYGALMRDHAAEEATLQEGRAAGIERTRRALSLSGGLDALGALILLGGALGVTFCSISPLILFVVLTVVRCLQSLNTSYEVANWFCLRSYLGIDARTREAKVFNTASFSEMGMGSATFVIAKWGTYMCALGLSLLSPPLFLTFSIAALVVGGLLASVPKLSFAVRCLWRSAEQLEPPVCGQSTSG